MKKGFTPCMLLLAALVTPMASQAESGFFAGGGIAHTQYVDANSKLLEELNTASLLIGYQPEKWRGFGVEGQLLEGQVEYDERPGSNRAMRFDYNSLAVYGSYRIGERFFFKARAGFHWQDWDSSERPELNRDETQGAVGIGFGWRFGGGKLELERLYSDDDLRQLTVNYTHNF